MFHEALNAPWLLIILYGLCLLSFLLTVWAARGLVNRAGTVSRILGRMVLAAILWGAGLALLGAAYLHDVWYC